MIERESWQHVADALGFKSEEEMLKHLYVEQEFSLKQMSDILGYCVWSIRDRLGKLGVPVRGKGGPQRTGKRRLKHLTDEELENTPVREIAIKHQVHISTVHLEIATRKREIQNAVRLHHASSSATTVRDALKVPHGTGPVSNE